MTQPLRGQTTTLSVDDALARLNVIEDYDPGDGEKPCVHTFVDAGFGLLGAHWALSDVRDLIERNGAEEAGDAAQSMQHGVVTFRDNGKPLFLETLDGATPTPSQTTPPESGATTALPCDSRGSRSFPGTPGGPASSSHDGGGR